MAHKSTAEIKKLLVGIKGMQQKEAASHLGISIPTLYKWKAKAKGVQAKGTAPAKGATTSKKVINLVKALKEKIEKLEKELV